MSPKTEGFQLSPQQKRLWRSQQDSRAYRAQCAILIEGDLDAEGLNRAFQEVAGRHEILRTVFRRPPYMQVPVQVVMDRPVFTWSDVDLSHMRPEEQEAAVERMLQEEHNDRFDFERGPLCRLSLLRLAAHRHVLQIGLPSLYADSRSIKNLARDVSRAYAAHQQAAEPLDDVAQYIEFSEWQHELLVEEDAEKGKEYWRKFDTASLSSLTLPFEGAPRKRQQFAPRSLSVRMEPALAAQIETLAERRGSSAMVFLLACWQALLRRLTGQPRIVVGMVCDGRTVEELHDALGLFAKWLPAQCHFDENLRFDDVFQRMIEVAEETYEWQEYFLLDQSAESAENDVEPPFFAVGFEFEDRFSEYRAAGVSFSIYKQFSILERFKIKLSCAYVGDALVAEFYYDSTLFSEEDIKRLAGNFQMLVASAAGNPEAGIDDLPILSPAERRQLLIDFNDTNVDESREKRIYQLFEEQAERAPDSIAILFGNESLTYGELNARSNQLAHYLRGLGVGPEVRVGICVERSLELAVGLLGILKAGGAYVPLDPAYPQERLAFMVADSQAPVLLTQRRLAAELPATWVALVSLDGDWEQIARECVENPSSEVWAESLAYIIYTSGSTGQPKGVQISHGNLLHSTWARLVYTWEPIASFLWISSFAFDSSVSGFFWTLSQGGTLVIPQPGLERDLQHHIDLLVRHRVSHFESVPSLYALLLAQARPQQLGDLRTMILAGEPCPGELVKRHIKLAPRTALFNEYGPTEGTVWCTVYDCRSQEPWDAIPIGRPIANTQIYLLDRQYQPVPIGVPGELHIGGQGVARGYLNRPELTAERFVPNPFAGVLGDGCWVTGAESSNTQHPSPNTRLYKTGDLARYLSDGNIEFLGRVDQQVKLRGYRIELGEIEATLRRHPDVLDSVAVSWEGVPGDARLVAYVVPRLQHQGAHEQALEGEYVSQFQVIYDQLYRQNQSFSALDPAINLKVWTSSYTNQPLPEEHIIECVEDTVQRVLALRPERVLEIGCGTGLLLTRIAPHCTSYWGTDISEAAVNLLRQRVDAHTPALSGVKLLHRAAHDFAGIAAGAFDAVIINEVVQHFPSMEYLINVLEGALRAVRPGGFLFVGGVRCLPLLDAFHAAVQLERAPAGLSRAELWQRVQAHLLAEKDLVIDPAFFSAVRSRFPRISHTQIQLKGGRYHNELTQFQYDVTLMVDPDIDSPIELTWLGWQEQGLTVPAVRRLLAETAPDMLAIARVPNARVVVATTLRELLARFVGPETVAGLRDALRDLPAGVEPDDLWAIGRELPYAVDISWSGGEEDGAYDVVFRRHTTPWVPVAGRGAAGARRKSWHAYANNPLQQLAAHSLLPELRTFLQTQLPEYMVPAAFVLLQTLPLTPQGKVDRRALPAPDTARSAVDSTYVAPRTPVEEVLAQIWADVLRMDRVGIHDHFFDSGGHSLLGTQVITRMVEVFQVELPLRDLFEAPTVEGLAARIVAARHNTARVVPPPLVPVAHDGPLPLSYSQQRLWFLDQLEPNSTVYIVPTAVRLNGPLDVTVLWQSLTAIMARHEVLRTTFVALDGQPAQVITPARPISLPLLDLQALPRSAREVMALQLVAAETQRPFDLARGPLLRGLLLRLNAEDHIVVLDSHHIISDAWSSNVFIRELVALYDAYAAGRPSPLPPLPIQYADYAVWQRQWLADAVLEAQLAYWQRQLADLPALDLPTDHARPAVPTFQGTNQPFMLPPELGAGLAALSRREDVTLFMALLAAWQLLLARYSGQDDIAVGTPIAGRTRAETEGLIGCFINTLVLRTDLRGDPSFREVLRQVREVCLDAYAHQELPFEQLVEAVQPERDLGRHPLFQVFFTLQNTPASAVDLMELGLVLRPLPIEKQATQFELSLSLVESAVGLIGALEYRADLFEPATITRMIGHFLVVLEEVVGHPEIRMADLSLLSAAERQQLLGEWNATAADYPHELCVHQLFEAQAERTPDVVAVVFERRTTNDERRTTTDHRPPTTDLLYHPITPSPHHPITLSQPAPCATLVPHPPSPGTQHLTYCELNERANRLAHHLRALGAGPEVPVAVCLERSLELVVVLLGVLKAGGAYVPLDPTYPKERLAFMLEDSRAAVLITTTGVTDKETRRQGDKETEYADDVTLSPLHLVTPSQRAVVYLDAEQAQIAGMRTDNPAGAARPDDLAYVIYTSGSTGRPKGIQVAHRAFANRLLWSQATYPLTESDRVLQLASMSFDIALWELLGPLVAGARLVMVRPGGHQDLPYLIDLIAEQQISMAHFVPSLLQVLLAQPGLERWQLRLVFCGGEAVPAELPGRFFARLDAELHQFYGPTEAAINVTAWACARESGQDRLPIGRPIANTQIYLLDRQLQPVPVGVAGELHIGGVQLARGYLGRPELTAERFIPNPFAGVTGDGYWVLEDATPNTRHPTPNTRLYRTGDLARYRADGNIEFLGRLDEQVKLRGFRVELGEVEVVLLRHPAVREAVAVAREDVPGDRRLVAYVVQGSGVRGQGSEDAALIPDPRSLIPELRAFLQERLPDYMVPAAFVALEALPLTPNGKIDRRALPQPEAARLAQKDGFAAPRTPAEEVLARLWADVLHVERVGAHDDFFALGGHSLLAVQLIARVREVFQVELSLRRLFEAPTVSELALRIAATRRAAPEALPPPLVPVVRGGALPLSFAQQRLWFLDQLQPDSPAYNVPARLRMDGALDVTALARSLHAIMERHEALRTTFATVDGRPIQLIARAQTPRLLALDLQALAAHEREAVARRLADEEALRPFDLAHGPLLRTTLLRLGSQEHIVLLTMHHIVSDAWSMEVVVREVASFYSAYAAGRPSPLPALPIQYADYAVWQREWLQGQVLEAQLSYWRRQLADLPTLELPSDRPRPPAVSFRGDSRVFALPAEVSAGLLALSRQAGVTPFMLLLAAWQVLLARYSGQDDIVVGTPIANRAQGETEGLIGFFLNTLVLRSDLAGNPPFHEALRHVRAVCLDAFDHQEVPFEQVVEALQPERDLSRHPLFQVVFVLEHAPAALALPDLTLRPFATGSTTAKVDLAISLMEGAGGLAGGLEYSTDLFDAATIELMLGHFQMLLAGIVAAPARRLADLPLLSEAERHQVLVEWNATRTEFRSQESGVRSEHSEHLSSDSWCIHHLFADQAARRPDAVALVFDGRPPTTDHRLTTNDQRRSTFDGLLDPQSSVLSSQSLTYAELNQRANRLAHHLCALGVAPEARVAVCMERSPELVIGLLGILKAGGAYVPLDPAYPQERLAFMLADSQARVLLTKETESAHDVTVSPPHLVTLSQRTVVDLRADRAAIARAEPTPPAVAVHVDQLAYVIYTSGSTGRPKGALLAHRGLYNLAQAQIRSWDVRPSDRILQFASPSFDASLSEICMALLAGATLCLAPAETLLPGPTLMQLLHEQAISVITLSPPVLLALPSEPLPTLRTLIVAGEACPPDLIVRWARGRRLFNAYGPTETTVCACFAECYDDGRAVPIGRPLANAQVYLLDNQQQPVPIGAAGELYVGGLGLARGYHNRPDLTAERFLPIPRLYKTGDWARYRADGQLEFLGRRDEQVKIRGIRIELGEIAAALRGHPAVDAAVALVREDAPGERRLVAYVVPATEDRRLKIEDSSPNASETLSSILYPLSSDLRAFLQERLPAYMVPAIFVVLDALPLTPNGKLDYRALPAPESSSAPLVLPQTQVEAILARIWGEVLRRDAVGVQDNFFALGGDSILSIQIVARAAQAGLRFTPKQIFQHQTIAALAAVATVATVARTPQDPVTGPAPLTPIQHWFFAQDLPAPHHFNQALMLAVRQPLDRALLARALQQLLDHHDALRLRFGRGPAGWHQFHAAPGRAVSLTVVDLSALPSAAVPAAIRVAAAQVQTSLDLTRGPLLRLALFECGPAQPQRLLLAAHHLVVDGVAWRVLLEDLQTAYTQLMEGAAVVLPPKTTSFQAWAEQLVAYAQSEALGAERAYWQAQAQRVLAPPAPDMPGGANTVATARSVAMRLSVDETQALLQEVPPVYQTQITEVLLTALALAWRHWSGAAVLRLDLEGHGREELFEAVDLTRTVGWFTTLYPVVLDLADAVGPGAALKAVKEQLRAVPQRGIGYGVLRYLGTPADQAELAGVEAALSFNYLGQVDQALPAEGLFGMAEEASGPVQDGAGRRPHALDMSAIIVGGVLEVLVSYSAARHRRETITRLAEGYVAALRELIAHCRAPDAGGYTPSDFAEYQWSQDDLDTITAAIADVMGDA